MKRGPFEDLKDAILAVLNDGIDVRIEFETDDCDNRMLVKRKLLKTLQAEYNIYFVEPEHRQVNVL